MAPPSGYNLVWSDEFNGATVDTTKWVTTTCSPTWACGGVDSITRACSLQENITVSNGELTLRCKRDTYNRTCPSCSPTRGAGNNKASMAWIRTRGLQSWKYGYFEFECKITHNPALWQSIWLVKPVSTTPEVDIIEYRGTSRDSAGNIIYTNRIYHASVYCYKCLNGGVDARGFSHSWTPGTGYHTIGYLWTPTLLQFFIDGTKWWEVTDTKYIPQDPMDLILSNQTMFDCGTFTYPNDFIFKSVKVYQLEGTITPALSITSPIAGTNWTRGTTKRIIWDTNITTGVVNILYVKGIHTVRITDDAHLVNVSQKYYDWAIPSDLTIGSDYKIIVATQQSPFLTKESGIFNIISQTQPEQGGQGFLPIIGLAGIFGVILVMAMILGKKQPIKEYEYKPYEEYDTTTGYDFEPQSGSEF